MLTGLPAKKNLLSWARLVVYLSKTLKLHSGCTLSGETLGQLRSLYEPPYFKPVAEVTSTGLLLIINEDEA